MPQVPGKLVSHKACIHSTFCLYYCLYYVTDMHIRSSKQLSMLPKVQVPPRRGDHI